MYVCGGVCVVWCGVVVAVLLLCVFVCVRPALPYVCMYGSECVSDWRLLLIVYRM